MAVADDQQVVREALSELIAADPGLVLIGHAERAEAAIALVAQERPDVLLLDVRMPGGGGERVAREVRSISPRTRILAFTAHDDHGTVMRMVSAGIAGYLVKDTPADEILVAVHSAVRGGARLSEEVTAKVVDELGVELQRRAEREEIRRRDERLVRERLRPGGVEVHLQPIVALAGRILVGYEALARFPGDPPRDTDRWFQVAADVELTAELELHAARTALRHLPDLPDHVYLSVNVSPDTAADPRLKELLVEVSQERIVLEVTEHARVDDYLALRDGLRPLRAGGLRLAVDDAGAGYASLNHILALDPDLIKLDVALTREVHTDRRQRALARAFATFGEEIGVRIVAEGVELEEQVDVLRELGVGLAQGYLLGRPAPA